VGREIIENSDSGQGNNRK
jgi:hypothetical protein